MSIHRRYVARRPVPFTVTRRKQLAQLIRNDLAAFKQLASDDDLTRVGARHRLLERIDRKLDELLQLEGLTRATTTTGGQS